MEEGRRGLSLFYRLLVAFLAIVAIISGIMTVAFYVFSKQSLERQVRERTLGEISAIRQSFHYSYQEDIVKNLKLLVSNPKLNDYITGSNLEKDIILLSVEKLFLKFIANEASYQNIYFVNSIGMETIKVDRNGPVRVLRGIKGNSLFRQIKSGSSERIYIEEPRLGASGAPSFTVGIHKTDDDIGQFGGAVMIDVTLEPFINSLQGIRLFGENPIWIIAPDGRVLHKPWNRAVTFDPAPYLGKEYHDKPSYMTVKEGILAYQDFAVVPGKPFLRLALSIPSSLLLKDTRSTTIMCLMIFLLSILLASAIALYLSRYLSRPIIELAAASKRLAEGDLSARVRLETAGEVQMLVDGFNHMAEDLQFTTVSKDYMDNIIHSIADSLIVLDRDMTIKTVNQALIELLGYREDELIGNRLEMFVAEESEANREESIHGGGIRNHEMIFRTKGGNLVPVLVTESVIFSKKREIIGQVVIGKDITRRKQAEEALREANDRLHATLQASPAAIMTLNTEGVVTAWNEAAERIFGWGKGEILGRFNPLVPKDEEDDYQSLLDRVRRGGIFYDMEVRRKKKDDTPIDISLSIAPLHDAKANVVGIMAVMNDITGKKKMEAELAKIQKLESIGILAGGIAHDFNNILTVILGYISLVKESVKPGHSFFGSLQEAEKASLRARDLTLQLLTFSKGGSPVKKTISISETIRESANFALRGSNVRCEFDLAEPLRSVEADEGQISQVIQNLVINANQAMPGGGTIRIRAGNAALAADGKVPLAEGKYVWVAIEDHGTGISEDHLPNIFDPYFTTKQKGSGLGLAIVYSIVNSHGGYIKVESTKGIGTTVTLYLPESERPAAAFESRGEELIPGSGKVLLMDDEESVRAVVGEMLKNVGYEVEVSKDGMEAIELYLKARELGNPFTAVIMDLTIPGGMGGEEAIRRLRQIDSEIKVIVSSGYSDDPVMANFREYGFNAVISKPFRIMDLCRTLHGMQCDAERV